MLVIPVVFCLVETINVTYDTGFNATHLTAFTLLLLGAGLIIQSKIGEAFTSRWKQFGPPLNEKMKSKYSLGYIMYSFGMVMMLAQYFGINHSLN